MARIDELNTAFTGIDADTAEMDRYRQQLRGRLPQRHPRRWAYGLVPLAAALLVAFWLLPGQDPFKIAEFRDFTAWAANQPAQALQQRAQAKLTAGNDLQRLNAHIALVLASTPNAAQARDQAVQAAATGLLNDPRPDARAFHLEYLLDEGDEYRYNLDMLEARMEQETDRLCYDLFQALIHIATTG